MSKNTEVPVELKHPISRSRTYEALSEFLRNEKVAWDNLSAELIEKFIQNILTKWHSKKPLLSYKIENLRIDLRFILESKGFYLSSFFKTRIRNKILSVATPLIEQAPIQDGRAATFSFRTVSRAINNLWNGDFVDKMAAVIMAITFTTGARVADTLRIRSDRISLVTNVTGNYLQIRLKTSKSNPMGRLPEQLTFKIDKENIIKTDLYLAKWLKIISRLKLIMIFPTTAKTIINRFRAVSKRMNLTPPITGHSGRNSVVKELYSAGVDNDSKIIKMRWVYTSKMPLHYRALLMEESEVGATFQLYKNKFNQRRKRSY